jgi:ATP phosphoribosyltransferase regulatory subunit
VGLQNFVIDLNMPGVVGALLVEEALENETMADILQAVLHKDISAISGFKLKHREALAELLHAVGPADNALARLSRTSLPETARTQVDGLARVVGLLKPVLPKGVRITTDFTEARALEYHTGITFSFFAPGSLAELGCGGRYRIDAESLRREGTGLTFYVGAISRMLPPPPAGKRVFIASAIDRGSVLALQEQGFVTVHALPDFGKTREEARALGCTHYLSGGTLEEL